MIRQHVFALCIIQRFFGSSIYWQTLRKIHLTTNAGIVKHCGDPWQQECLCGKGVRKASTCRKWELFIKSHFSMMIFLFPRLDMLRTSLQGSFFWGLLFGIVVWSTKKMLIIRCLSIAFFDFNFPECWFGTASSGRIGCDQKCWKTTGKRPWGILFFLLFDVFFLGDFVVAKKINKSPGCCFFLGGGFFWFSRNAILIRCYRLVNSL